MVCVSIRERGNDQGVGMVRMVRMVSAQFLKRGARITHNESLKIDSGLNGGEPAPNKVDFLARNMIEQVNKSQFAIS